MATSKPSIEGLKQDRKGNLFEILEFDFVILSKDATILTLITNYACTQKYWISGHL